MWPFPLESIAADSSPIRLKEDPSQPHWYHWVFDNEIVQSFIRKHAGKPSTGATYGCGTGDALTFTVAVPAESNTFCGLRVEKLCIPGRYGCPGVGNLLVGL